MIINRTLPAHCWLYCILLWTLSSGCRIYAAPNDEVTHPSSVQNASSSGSAAPIQTMPLHIVTQPLEITAQAHEIYFYRLLELALQKTQDTHGPYHLEQFKRILTNKRYVAEVTRANGMIDVIWTMIDQERDKNMHAIKISLLRDLNSYRVFLIRAEDQHKFAEVTRFEDLKHYIAGSGSNWPDTPILQANGLRVMTSAHFELLFNMLERKRFDYFPRGLYEVWTEQKKHAQKGFAIEETLMFYYPAPIYFFVNKQNTQLAERIERGLQIAMADGSFDALFFSIPGFKQGFNEIKNNKRRVFRLNTPQEANNN